MQPLVWVLRFLIVILLVWFWASNVLSDGSADPLPYVPLLNPVDLVVARHEALRTVLVVPAEGAEPERRKTPSPNRAWRTSSGPSTKSASSTPGP